ncbi:fasciclin domain-containing protein [Croceiramulus getboli]|nr:fasciclin domain-containing protein [Flavobacteriaceae bacterium YJPT1-3]
MNTLSKISRLWLVAALVLGLSSCSDDDDGGDPVPATQTIAEIVTDDSDFSNLLAALQQTGLDATLADADANFTVFAPTNAAFEAYLGDTALSEVPNDVLTALLLNHVLITEEMAFDLETGYYATAGTYGTSSSNIDLYVTKNGDNVLINGGSALDGGANVTLADVNATNGVIHVVDAVIELPTIVTFVSVDPSFDTLLAALSRDDQPDFPGILSQTEVSAGADFNPPYTVFAPNNDAFNDLLLELDPTGETALGDIDGATLTAALLLHVINGANVTAADLEAGVVQTAGGEVTLTLDTPPTITDARGRVSTILVTDVQTSNGVIHAIDTVLLPPSEEEPQ